MRPLFFSSVRHATSLLLLMAATGVFAAGNPPPARAAERLVWRGADQKVSAQIDGWPLERLLGTLAARTRWQVFVDPQATHVVNAKFKDLPPGEALRRLLGPLNYVLLPTTNGPARLYVFRTSQNAATQRIESPSEAGARGRRLEDELILRLKPGSEEDIDALAKRLGATVVGRSDALQAYRLKFESAEAAEAARQELAGNDGVKGTDSNYLVDRPETAGLEVSAAGAGLNLKVKTLAPGEGLVVAVVDTAVQGQAAGISEFLLPEVAVAGKANLPADELAHGTSMAATLLQSLAQVSENPDGTSVRLLPVDVYGNNPSASSYDIALGIHAAVTQGASVVNLSLGGYEESPFVHDLIRSAHDQGVVFLAAAGNEPVSAPTFPAAYPEVIAVTAVNRQGEVAPYANYGQFVDVGAPGTSYISFWGQPFVVVGTSPATASASALAASIAATTGKRGAELEAQIRGALSVNPAELAP